MSRVSLPVFSKMLGPAAGARGRGGSGGRGGGPGAAAAAEAARKEAPAAKLDLEDAVHDLYPVRRESSSAVHAYSAGSCMPDLSGISSI